MKCSADTHNSRRADRLRFKQRRPRLKPPEKRYSKSSRERKRKDVLRLSTLKTCATSCTCRSWRSRLVLESKKNVKNVKRSSRIS
jgi:hypothetical protein